MSLSRDLMEVTENLIAAEDEVASIAGTIKQIRHDHAVTIAGLEELLEQANADLDDAQVEAIRQAALFAGEMAVWRTSGKQAS